MVAPERKTRVRVLYDSQAIWFGIEAQDPRPQEIRKSQARFDQVFRMMDFLVVYIDPVGSKKAAQFFRVSALGGTADGLHTHNDDNEDFSPDFDFNAHAQATDTGWEAVLRIPYESLRYDPNSNLPWRVMVGRRIPRDTLGLDLSVPLKRETTSFIENMQVLEGFNPIARPQFVWLRPTLTLRDSQQTLPTLNRQKDVIASLDFKWSPRTELVIDGTINPDFSQTELDQIDLSRNRRFALFKQEKRPLFLESRDLLSSLTNAVYTRSISDPQWALRASWRGENNSATSLVTRDRGNGVVIIPGSFGSNYANQPAHLSAFARGTRQISSNELGWLLSHREYVEDRGSNSVVGVDGNYRFSESLNTRMQVLASSTSALADPTGQVHKANAQTGFLLATNTASSTAQRAQYFRLNWISEGFRNDTGFVSQTGIQQVEYEYINKRWKPETVLGQKVSQADQSLNFSVIRDIQTGKLISAYLTPNFWFETAGGAELSIQLRGLSLLRRDPLSPIMRERYLHLWSQALPGGQLKLIEGALDVGKLADFTTNQVRSGISGFIFARYRPVDLIELEPRVNFFALMNSSTTISREASFQLLAILHLKPNHVLRFINQQSWYARIAEPQFNTVDERYQSSRQSLTYIWRESASNALFIGANFGQSGSPTSEKSREIFFKWQRKI